MKSLKQLSNRTLAFVPLLVAALLLASLMPAPAVDSATTSTRTKKNPEAISPELAAELQTVEQSAIIEPSALPDQGRGATYYSAQCPYWPPLPGNVFDLPVWNLGDNNYLIDDLAIDYSATAATTTTTAVSAATMQLRASPMDQNSDTSSTNDAPGYPYLTIAPTTTNGVFMITVFNTNTATYHLQMTPLLGDTGNPFQTIADGAVGQTNFIVSGIYPDEFFRVSTNDPSAGIAIFIDTPANGTTVQ